MDNLSSILDRVTAVVQAVKGVEAVVLGGSRARGTHTQASDVDIGLYYEAEALDLPALQAAAQQLDDAHRGCLIAAPGEWGPWVNGGGWLRIEGCPVDFLLRDVERVKAVIGECRRGVVTPHYQVGHPHAYISSMYMGELAVCRLLWDRTGDMARWKAVAEVYPDALREAVMGCFTFEAGFSCQLAGRSAGQGDAYYVTAHLVRALSCLNQVLFASNRQYCLNEKRAVAMIDTFALKPASYKRRVEDILAQAAIRPAEACAALRALLDDAAACAKEALARE